MATLLGKKIHDARKKQGFSLDKLADLIGSSKSYMWELENKDDINPTADKLSKLANALKIPVEYLLNNDQEELTEDDSSKVFYRRYEKLTADKKVALDAVLEALEREQKL